MVETPTEPVFVSALHQEGLGNLTERLRGNLRSIVTHQVGESAPLTRERHRAIAESAIEALDRALMQDDLELKTEDLRLAVRELGRMTGRVDVEDVLDRIFSEFCIGK
jgi:tRNA modification GTPase